MTLRQQVIFQVMLLSLLFNACHELIAVGQNFQNKEATNDDAAKPNASGHPWETPTHLSFFMAQNEEVSYKRIDTLLAISSVLTEAGFSKQALEALKQAAVEGLQRIHSREAFYWETRRIRNIVSSQLKAGSQEQAKATVTRALKSIKEIENQDRKNSALRNMVDSLILVGETEQALELAQVFILSSKSEAILNSIVSNLIQLNKTNEAIEVARKIESRNFKSLALRTIASSFVKNGQKKKALELLKESQSLSPSNLSPSVQLSRLSEYASILLAAGEKEQAMTLLNQALETSEEIENVTYKCLGLMRIINVLIRAEARAQALATLQKMLVEVEKIELANIKESIYRFIGGAYANLGKLEESLVMTQKIESPKTIVATLSWTALGLVQKGNDEQAREIFQQTAEGIEKFEKASVKTSSLLFLSRALLKTGKMEYRQQALENLRRAIQITKDCQDVSERLSLVLHLLQVINQTKDSKLTLLVLNQSFELTKQIETVSERKSALLAIAMNLVKDSTPKVIDYRPVHSANSQMDSAVEKMKKNFTLEEKQLAKQLVEAIQGR